MTFLSSIGAVFSRPGMQAVAGLMSGAVAGSALVASGAIPFGGSATAAPSVILLACPGAGPVLAELSDGEALLVTARSADGTWLQVHIGQPGVDRGWAPAAALRMESAADALPVADCSGPSAAPSGSPAATASAIVATASPSPSAPSPTPTTAPTAAPTPTITPRPTATPTPRPTPTPTPRPTPTPSPKPTPKPTPTPVPTPTPTPPPDTTAPTLSNLIITSPGRDPNDGQFYIYGQGCPPPQTATVTVNATDPDDPVSAVTLYYWPGGSGVLSTSMVKQSNSNVWVGTIVAQGWDAGQISYWVRAVDTHGNIRQLDQSNNYILTKGMCFL